MVALEVWAQILVAFGTLALAGVASWQLFVLKRRARRERAREVQDRFYVPLRNEIEAWLDPRQDFRRAVFDKGSSDPAACSFQVWPEVKWRAPYLLPHARPELIDLLNRTEDTFREVAALSGRYERKAREAMQAAAPDILDLEDEQRAGVKVEVRAGEDWIGNLEPYSLWVTRSDPQAEARERAGEHREDRWALVVKDGNEVMGETSEAVRLLEAGIASLEEDPEAGEHRDRVDELRRLAQETVGILEEELDTAPGLWEVGEPPRRQGKF